MTARSRRAGSAHCSRPRAKCWAIAVIDGNLQPWAGLRPATPSGRPIIGRSPLANLFLNVGHGSLGWTLAAGSARLVCDAVAGRAPTIDSAPFALPAR